jgi:hypothetical protein
MAGTAMALAAEPILPDNMQPCGKFWFKSEAEAEEKISRDGMHSIKGPAYALNVYYCYGCDGYHIGHTLIKKMKDKR